MSFKDFFCFSKADRSVLLVLISVGIIALLVVFIVDGTDDYTNKSSVVDKNSGYKDSASDFRGKSKYYYVEGKRAELFPFDPNTADSTQFLRLGLQPWQVRNIYKYRAAGGIYRKPSDFSKLYGLTVKQYRDMEPYICISSDYAPASSVYSDNNISETQNGSRGNQRDTMKYPIKLKLNERISLNTADTNALKKVPGIGSGYARAIVKYRDRLGGFYTARQLCEIEGLPEESLKYFDVSRNNIRKININKLTLSQLRRHPYLNYFQAKAIVDYKRARGPLKNLQQLQLLKEFPQEQIARLEPYIEY